MKTIPLKNSTLSLPVLGMGTWAIAGGDSWGSFDKEEGLKTIDVAIGEGITYFDTAPAYGNGRAEELLGSALEGRRDKCIISTKCGLRWDNAVGFVHKERDGVIVRRNLRKESIIWEVEQSLKRLKTDYIDLYITHWPDPETPLSESLEALEALKKEGKIRAYGASNTSLDLITSYGEGLSLIQERMSMLSRKNEPLLKASKEKGIAFQAYSPLERGMLSGRITKDTPIDGSAKKSVIWYADDKRGEVFTMLDNMAFITSEHHCTTTQAVLAWTMAQGALVLTGARHPETIMENVKSADITLSDDEVAYMTGLADGVLSRQGM